MKSLRGMMLNQEARHILNDKYEGALNEKLGSVSRDER